MVSLSYDDNWKVRYSEGYNVGVSAMSFNVLLSVVCILDLYMFFLPTFSDI